MRVAGLSAPAVPVALLGIAIACPACGELTNAVGAILAPGRWLSAEAEPAKRLAADLLSPPVRARRAVGELRRRPDADAGAGGWLNACWWCDEPLDDFLVFAEGLRESLREGLEAFEPLARSWVPAERWRRVSARPAPAPVVALVEDAVDLGAVDPAEVQAPWVKLP